MSSPTTDPRPFLAQITAAPVGLDAVRRHAAVARTLLDELDRVLARADGPAAAERTVEQLARLGCRLLDAAARLAEHADLATPALLAYD